MREVGLKMCNVSAAEDLAAVSFVSAAQLAAGQQCGQAPAPQVQLQLAALYQCCTANHGTAPPDHDSVTCLSLLLFLSVSCCPSSET